MNALAAPVGLSFGGDGAQATGDAIADARHVARTLRTILCDDPIAQRFAGQLEHRILLVDRRRKARPNRARDQAIRAIAAQLPGTSHRRAEILAAMHREGDPALLPVQMHGAMPSSWRQLLRIVRETGAGD